VECSIVYGLVWLIGLGGLRGDVAGAARTLVVITPGLLGGSFLALGEEIGWRGLLVPQLATLTTFTKTALISGGIQAVWHWPFVLFVGFTSAAPPWYALSILTVTVTLAGFAAAWLRLRSGSVWPVVLAHASFNLYVQSGFNKLTEDTGPTEYVVDEFGLCLRAKRIGDRLHLLAPAPPLTTIPPPRRTPTCSLRNTLRQHSPTAATAANNS